MQHLQLGIFVVAMIAIVVCGCILRANQKTRLGTAQTGRAFCPRAVVAGSRPTSQSCRTYYADRNPS
jgi:hypothetical protein